jgi:dTDP-4-dehydrorhamnose reductase
MLGHKTWQTLGERFECWATVRSEPLDGPAAAVLDADRTVTGVRAEDPASVWRALDEAAPDVAVNCIGLVKQADAASDTVAAIRVNALFPHELADACRARGTRLLHVSTDCVFSGERGAYAEDDTPDARDTYGRSKLLGEPVGAGCLTIRTSIVGRELATSHGLVEWLIGESGGAVPGFRRAAFSGMTTLALARELGTLIERHRSLDGLFHLGADRITKHDLLILLRDRLELDVEIVADDAVAVDRSLDSTRYREATNRRPPSWPEMVQGLARDPTPYDPIRREVAQR